MKLGIFCNFGPFEHVGGSEMVIEHISRGLVEEYGYEVSIYASNYKKSSVYQGINLYPCKKGKDVISQVNENDHIFVYSDSTWCFDTIVENIEEVVPDVTVSLVGAYGMKSNPKSRDLFLKHRKRYNIVTHSGGNDYKWALDKGLDATIIPNGVDLGEFRHNSINFREKYNIKEKYMFLNVSSFFFGKGQDMLAEIGKKIKESYEIVQISSSIEYPYGKRFLNRCQDKCRNVNVRFLRDIPRQDVVAAFKASDVFIFTSLKEVCPLVILESQAAGTPWISMNVGNVNERKGGKVINNNREDGNGYKIMNNKIVMSYLVSLADIVELEGLNTQLAFEGQEDIQKLDWSNIVPDYDRIFRS